MSKYEGYYHIVKSPSGKVHLTTSSRGIIKAVCGSIMKHYSTFKDPDDARMDEFFKYENRCKKCEKFFAVHFYQTVNDRDYYNTVAIQPKHHIVIPNFDMLDTVLFKSVNKILFPILGSGYVLHFTSHDRTAMDIKAKTLCNIVVENKHRKDDGTLVQVDRGIMPVYECMKCQAALELFVSEGVYFTIILDPEDEKEGRCYTLPERQVLNNRPQDRNDNIRAKVIKLSERKLKPKSRS